MFRGLPAPTGLDASARTAPRGVPDRPEIGERVEAIEADFGDPAAAARAVHRGQRGRAPRDRQPGEDGRDPGAEVNRQRG